MDSSCNEAEPNSIQNSVNLIDLWARCRASALTLLHVDVFTISKHFELMKTYLKKSQYLFLTTATSSTSWSLAAPSAPSSWDAAVCLFRLTGTNRKTSSPKAVYQKQNHSVGPDDGLTSCFCRWCTPEFGKPDCAAAPPETDTQTFRLSCSSSHWFYLCWV